MQPAGYLIVAFVIIMAITAVMNRNKKNDEE